MSPRTDPTEHTLHGVLTRIRRGNSPTEDRELMLKLNTAFGKHVPRLSGYVRKEFRAATAEQVEEIVQDVLTEAWSQLQQGRYEPHTPFRAFLIAIARNRCANARRKKADLLHEDGVVEVASDEPSALAQLQDVQRDALVEEAARNVLDVQDQHLAVLRWVLDYPLEDVAEQLGWTDTNQVRVALQRCKRRMEKEIPRLLAQRGLGPSFLGGST